MYLIILKKKGFDLIRDECLKQNYDEKLNKNTEIFSRIKGV